MRKLTGWVIVVLATALFGGERTSSASPQDTFPDFPPSCAQQAYEQLALDLQNPTTLSSVVRDANGKWEDRVYQVYSTYADMMAPSTELLSRYADNRSKPRVSDSQSLQAKRIYDRYEEKILNLSPVLNDLGSWNESPEILQYKCITETCPAGVTCTTRYLRDEGAQFARRFTLFRRFFNQTTKWASRVTHLKGHITKMTKQYEANQRRLLNVIDELPERVYVIDEYIARR